MSYCFGLHLIIPQYLAAFGRLFYVYTNTAKLRDPRTLHAPKHKTHPLTPPLFAISLVNYDTFPYNRRHTRGEIMDTKRWKSVLVPREIYDEIKDMAQSEGRTISGQLRLIFETYVDNGFDKKHAYDPKRDPRRINVYD